MIYFYLHFFNFLNREPETVVKIDVIIFIGKKLEKKLKRKKLFGGLHRIIIQLSEKIHLRSLNIHIVHCCPFKYHFQLYIYFLFFHLALYIN